MQVIKRDGTIAEFNKTKIEDAVTLANSRTDKVIPGLGKEVAETLSLECGQEPISITKVEAMVESALSRLDADTYRAYSTYRQAREDVRFKGSDIAQHVRDIIFNERDERENGNLDENTFAGRSSKMSSVLSEEFTRTHLVSRESLEAFDKGAIHIHDFSSYAKGDHNCTTIDLADLLANGCITKNGGVRPPKSFRAAINQTYLLIGSISQNQFGGCAITGFDSIMAPYIKSTFVREYTKVCTDLGISIDSRVVDVWTNGIDNIVGLASIEVKAYNIAYRIAIQELYQGMESLMHSLATTHSREGNQLSFSSINYGNDSTPEAALVSKCILEVRAQGIGINREIPVFPIGVFQYSPCLHGEGKPLEWLFDMACESTSKNVYPNYVYVPDEASKLDWRAKESSMGCRTQNGIDRHNDTLDRTGRGNISPVTLSLPYVALEAEGSFEKFQSLIFDTYLPLMEKTLLDRFDYQANQKAKSAPFLYANRVLKSAEPIQPTDTVRAALKHGSLVFGYIGMAEACNCLFGKHHGEDSDVHAIMYEFMSKVKAYTDSASDRNDLNMSLYATPAESLCLKARNKAVKQFGVVENVTDREYFTNSHHVPVYYNISGVHKIDKEVPFSKLATAGNIIYNEFTGEASNNPKAVKTMVRTAMDREVPYYAANIPRDTCACCGYKGWNMSECPKCGSTEIKELRRITGYTTSEVKQMNDGKQAEVRDRVKHVHVNSLGIICE